MNSMEYINSLSPEEKAAAYKKTKRLAAKHILTFVAIKVALYTAIYYAAKKARELS